MNNEVEDLRIEIARLRVLYKELINSVKNDLKAETRASTRIDKIKAGLKKYWDLTWYYYTKATMLGIDFDDDK